MVFEEFGVEDFLERRQRQALVLAEERLAAVEAQFARRVPHQHALLVLEVLQLVAQLFALLEPRLRQFELLHALEDALVEQQDGPAHGAGRPAEAHFAGPAHSLADLGDGADALAVLENGLFFELGNHRPHELARPNPFSAPVKISGNLSVIILHFTLFHKFFIKLHHVVFIIALQVKFWRLF